MSIIIVILKLVGHATMSLGSANRRGGLRSEALERCDCLEVDGPEESGTLLRLRTSAGRWWRAAPRNVYIRRNAGPVVVEAHALPDADERRHQAHLPQRGSLRGQDLRLRRNGRRRDDDLQTGHRRLPLHHPRLFEWLAGYRCHGGQLGAYRRRRRICAATGRQRHVLAEDPRG